MSQSVEVEPTVLVPEAQTLVDLYDAWRLEIEALPVSDRLIIQVVGMQYRTFLCELLGTEVPLETDVATTGLLFSTFCSPAAYDVLDTLLFDPHRSPQPNDAEGGARWLKGSELELPVIFSAVRSGLAPEVFDTSDTELIFHLIITMHELTHLLLPVPASYSLEVREAVADYYALLFLRQPEVYQYLIQSVDLSPAELAELQRQQPQMPVVYQSGEEKMFVPDEHLYAIVRDGQATAYFDALRLYFDYHYGDDKSMVRRLYVAKYEDLVETYGHLVTKYILEHEFAPHRRRQQHLATVLARTFRHR